MTKLAIFQSDQNLTGVCRGVSANVKPSQGCLEQRRVNYVFNINLLIKLLFIFTLCSCVCMMANYKYVKLNFCFSQILVTTFLIKASRMLLSEKELPVNCSAADDDADCGGGGRDEVVTTYVCPASTSPDLFVSAS